jgi:hypothetical protein
MIPQEKSAAVTKGLREAFGVTEFEDIRKVTGGPGLNPVFRVVVHGSPYLLRLNMRAGDVGCHYACMKAAAEAGLAPRVWYSSVEDRISITDFVEAVPFPRNEALVRIPAALQRLHALSPFPGRADHLNTSCMFLLNKGPALDGFIQKFQPANILPRERSEELFARLEQISSVYPRQDGQLVSSHNDLFKPDNMLFDGQRMWLIDWEAAFLNDRYADLAVVANQIVTNDAEETAYLQAYFGERPDPYQRARLHLMQQVSHIFYTIGFTWMGSSGKPVAWSAGVPEFRDFQQRIWRREVTLSDPETKITYGRVHYDQLLKNTQQARFDEALRIVAERHARS